MAPSNGSSNDTKHKVKRPGLENASKWLYGPQWFHLVPPNGPCFPCAVSTCGVQTGTPSPCLVLCEVECLTDQKRPAPTPLCVTGPLCKALGPKGPHQKDASSWGTRPFPAGGSVPNGDYHRTVALRALCGTPCPRRADSPPTCSLLIQHIGI